MHSPKALATAVALADYLETYTSDVHLENIVRLAEALQRSGTCRRWPAMAPEDLGDLIDALPSEVMRHFKSRPPARA